MKEIDDDEKMSRKISSVLEKICPAFIKDSDPHTSVEWHKCYCKATRGRCTCVWHIKDNCRTAGTWKNLSFVKKCNDDKENDIKNNIEKVNQSINEINANDLPINNRFQILDI